MNRIIKLVKIYTKLSLVIFALVLILNYIWVCHDNAKQKTLYYVDHFEPDCAALLLNDSYVCVFYYYEYLIFVIQNIYISIS